MLKKVKAFVDKFNLIPQDIGVLAACSGGPDSLALVQILSELRENYRFTLNVAHVDHMFRGEESRQDREFVAEFCRGLGLTLYQTALDVPRFMKESGLSAEEAARIMRYGYLREVAKTLGGALIATGHHRDDQAETVLMHLLRGSGSDGLSGMKPQNGDVIRPLLVLNRSEIESYCLFKQFKPRLDSTNLSTEYLRNDIRLKLLPLLKQEYNQAITDALCRMAEIIGDEHAVVRNMAQAVVAEAVIVKDEIWVVEGKCIAQLPVAVQRECFRQIIEKKQGHLKGITFSNVEKLIQLTLSGETGSMLQLPGGCIVRKEYERLYVGIGGGNRKKRIEPPGIRLNIPGITRLDDGSSVQAELFDKRPERKDRSAVFDWRLIKQPIIVRNRIDGDRFRPLGMSGTKKVKDFFIDAKISRQDRDAALVFLADGEIIWLGGYRQSEYGKTTRETVDFLQLTLC